MRFPLRVFCRITLELTAPCAVGSGEDSVETDQPFATDFNGLPALPGSGLAGMLRAAFRRSNAREISNKRPSQFQDSRAEETWFGWQRADKGESSRVRFSWGHIHDEDDRPVEGLKAPEQRSDFLGRLSEGLYLDHVRISHLGTAEERGKFDRRVVMSGARFTFDLEIVGKEKNSLEELMKVRDELLELLHGPTTRLGGATHSGFGTFKLVRVYSGAFDLRELADFEAFCAIPARLDKPTDLATLNLSDLGKSAEAVEQVDMTLSPETFFLVGGAQPAQQPGDDGENPPDINPVRRAEIEWKNHRGAFKKPALYIPATAIKGAIRHRVAFHYNRLNAVFSEQLETPEEAVGEQNQALRELFGYCKDSRGGAQDGASGRLLFSDIELCDYEGFERKLMHTSVDSFTGGVRNRMLFSELALSPNGPDIELSIFIEEPRDIDGRALQALRLALEDLAAGRLAIGSGSGRGNGRFRGTIRWPNALKELNKAAANDLKEEVGG